MKKLNRKGFTLIELLAIIVILAIIMVVTIPTVLNSMGSAKQQQLDNAAESVAEWLQKQYDLSQMGGLGLGETGVNGTFDTAISGGVPTTETDFTAPLLTAAGIADASANIKIDTAKSSTWYYVSSTGRMCVKLTGNGGSFGDATSSSSGCPATE